MYIFKNALQNILRNRGRNIILGIIILVIVVSAVTALMINNTAAEVIDDYKTRFGSEVTLNVNMEKMMENLQSNNSAGEGGRGIRFTTPEITATQYLSFGESEYLQSAKYLASGMGNSDDLVPIDEDLGGGGTIRIGGGMLNRPNQQSDESEEETEETEENPLASTEYYFRLYGNNYEDFNNGLRELAEGVFPENDNECIISVDLLENSGLSIGDKVTVTTVLTKMPEEEGGETLYKEVTLELTIVGSYNDATAEYSNDFMQNAFTNRRNEIITNFSTLALIVEEDYTGVTISATFYLNKPEDLDAFAAELTAKGLSEYYDVTTDSSSYNTIVKPVESMKSVSVVFVVIVLIFGAIIIFLLSSIAIRERKYEIGVLRAMGMKKMKVALGLWSETLVITLACLILGLGIGMVAAQPVSDILIEQQISAADTSDGNTNAPPSGIMGGGRDRNTGAGGNFTTSPIWSSISGNNNSNAQPLESIDVSLSLTTLLEIIGIALLLTSIAGIAATQKITKYEPIKILMERN